MQKILIVDSSTLIALERGKIMHLLDEINYKIKITNGALEEIGSPGFKNYEVEKLSGRSIEAVKNLSRLGIGKGEAESIALAAKLNKSSIICDDIKLMRQLFFSNNSKLKEIKLLGFSFFLHLFHKGELLGDIWVKFYEIINKCKWERSEVLISNFTFLKERGY